MKPEEAISMLMNINDINDEDAIVAILGTWYKGVENDFHKTLDMAIAALKKQIPVRPKRIDKNAEFDGNWKKVCPVCGRVLVERITTPEKSYPRHYNMTGYCCCGQKILWE